jgi:hypothetical protein
VDVASRLTLAFLLCALAPVYAQQPREVAGHPEMAPERFLEITQDRPDGLGVSISWLKFSRIFDATLKVYDEHFDDLLRVEDPQLRALIATKGHDSTGSPLARRQNIQVVGTGKRLPDGGYVLVVEHVYGLEGDLERYTRATRRLPKDDAAARLELAAEVRQRVKASLEGDERAPVLQLARSLEEAARAIERKQLPALPGGAETWLAFGRRYRQIRELDELWRHGKVPENLKRQAETILGQLGARRHLGRWLSEADYHETVGFVKRDERWVPKQYQELRVAADEQLAILRDPKQGGPWPPASDAFLKKAAAEGSIVRGQRKTFALLAILQMTGKSQLPVRVDRWRERVEVQPGQEAARIWERWEMPDGRLLFFMQGRVIKDVAPE